MFSGKRKECSAKLKTERNVPENWLKMSYLLKNDVLYFVKKVVKSNMWLKTEKASDLF